MNLTQNLHNQAMEPGGLEYVKTSRPKNLVMKLNQFFSVFGKALSEFDLI